METTNFFNKLNKVDGKIYVIEEEIRMPDTGNYEAELQHDNIIDGTLTVYTGPKLTGEQINTYVLSTPSLTPWKKRIRIQTSASVVYICYETDGDTVEADDINRTQAAINVTQEAVNTEEDRAAEAERELTKRITAEVERAQGTEKTISDDLTAEIARAKSTEAGIQWGLESHGNDAVRHITQTERAEWADAYEKRHIHGNKALLDGITQAMIDKWGSSTMSAKHVNADTDLNNVTAEGWYYCPANATVATFSNCPTVNAFFMEVGKHAGTFQRLVEYQTNNPKIYFRNLYHGTWGPWYREYTTANKPTVDEIGAAAATHNHDGVYLHKGPLTWGALKGV